MFQSRPSSNGYSCNNRSCSCSSRFLHDSFKRPNSSSCFLNNILLESCFSILLFNSNLLAMEKDISSKIQNSKSSTLVVVFLAFSCPLSIKIERQIHQVRHEILHYLKTQKKVSNHLVFEFCLLIQSYYFLFLLIYISPYHARNYYCFTDESPQIFLMRNAAGETRR